MGGSAAGIFGFSKYSDSNDLVSDLLKKFGWIIAAGVTVVGSAGSAVDDGSSTS